jgi:hypothetical protein
VGQAAMVSVRDEVTLALTIPAVAAGPTTISFMQRRRRSIFDAWAAYDRVSRWRNTFSYAHFRFQVFSLNLIERDRNLIVNV